VKNDLLTCCAKARGIQEETTILEVLCLTLRNNTERPSTVDFGTSVPVGQDVQKLKPELGKILPGKAKLGIVPPLWDGRAGERVAKALESMAAYDLRESIPRVDFLWAGQPFATR
jgi:UDP-N-acetylglucosamine 2-epimerase